MPLERATMVRRWARSLPLEQQQVAGSLPPMWARAGMEPAAKRLALAWPLVGQQAQMGASLYQRAFRQAGMFRFERWLAARYPAVQPWPIGETRLAKPQTHFPISLSSWASRRYDHLSRQSTPVLVQQHGARGEPPPTMASKFVAHQA